MPNWTRNIVTVVDKRAIKDLLKTLPTREGGEEQVFDFERLLPTPKELDPYSDRYIDKLSMEEKLLFMKDNGGIDNWYDWHIKYWGAKWNACETTVVNDNKVIFITPWSSPEPIFMEMSRRYKTKVEVKFANEDYGGYCGTAIYEYGAMTDLSLGDEHFAGEVWNE